MKTKLNKLVAVATVLGATAMNAKADGVADALDAAGDYSTAVGAGSTAIIAVALVFVGIKLGKRLLSKI